MLVDEKILEYIPHRSPMLLINHIVNVEKTESKATVVISKESSFFNSKKDYVPSWVGLEYMGQTAALIAGYQLEQGMTEPHLGFLLGTRNYSVTTSGFEAGVILEVVCKEKAVVGDGLATFDCSIFIQGQDAAVAKAGLTVFRRKVEA